MNIGKISVDGEKFNVEDIKGGFLITSNKNQYIIAANGFHFTCADDISKDRMEKISNEIIELIWDNANGI